ncbi:MAG: PAC2 family protein [Candidatus Diapherotrites archaeon]
MKPEVEFVEFKKNDLKGFTLIEGYPGMGLVGTLAAKFLVEKKKFEYIGYIDSNTFAPVVRIHNAMPVRPARIYSNKEKKIAVVLSEQVFSREVMHVLAKKTVDWIHSKGIKQLISLSGVNTHSVEHKEIIYGIAANETSKSILKKYGLKEIEDGITTGITALILLELRQSKTQAISILANVNYGADYKAAAEILKKLDEIFGLSLNVQPLIEEAKEAERQFLEQLERLQKTKDSAEKFETKTPLIT